MITRPDIDDVENILGLPTIINHSKENYHFKLKNNRFIHSYPYTSQNANYINKHPVVNSIKRTRLDRRELLLDPVFTHSVDTSPNSSMELSFNEFMTDNRLPRLIEDDLYPKEARDDCKDKFSNTSLKDFVETFSTDIDNDMEHKSVLSKDHDIFDVKCSPKSVYVENTLCQMYDTSSIILSNDDEMRLGAVNCNDILKPSKTLSDKTDFYTSSLNTTDCSSVETPESPEEYCSNDCNQTQDQDEEDQFYGRDAAVIEDKKGKISDMQRIALDAIFSIVDRPSRGLVLHISEELNLHHITIKNFFSNGRRRLRRAAARVNDPERTRRENQRRKEKRRLASLAAALSKEKAREKSICTPYNNPVVSTSNKQKDQHTISPERKKLMEKLAVKIQKSVAQKAQIPSLRHDAVKLSNNAPSSSEISPNDAIFSQNEHSSHNESFHLYASSQNKLNDENMMDELYQEYAVNEPFDFYTANLCQDSVYPNEFLVGDEEKKGPVKRTRPFSPLNWKSLLYA